MSIILAIEDDSKSLDRLQEVLGPGHDMRVWSGRERLNDLLEKKEFEVVLLSLQVRRADWETLLKAIKEASPHTPVLAISEIDEPSLVVKAVKEGAFDFVSKPFSREKITLAIDRAVENRRLRNEIDYLRHEQDILYDLDTIVAESPKMKRTMTVLRKFSRTDSTILITGATGTGKSFLSGAIHFNSGRREKPFVKINCANIPENLMESEMFGHEKGAFTGAGKTRVGRLEQARGGTVLLDEIGELTMGLQAKLLRVLEDKSFERLGGNRTIHSDVRIIAATNRRPEDQVAAGVFRGDLYYRLNILRVHLPPLAERKSCIVPLAEQLLRKSGARLKGGGPPKGFAPEVLELFKSHDWPGNIRQMANSIERAVILEESDMIQRESIHLPAPGDAPAPAAYVPPNLLAGQERKVIMQILEENHWVQKDAANQLGISPRSLNYKIKRLGITCPRWRRNV
ncbi:MAG: sigma-54-dependent Fis family transcriptional regulator [Desulfobacterales bacterium]|nr:sigma-54-dependent Fis family transcriptional regulator [Desulfobacterales bacterium]